MSAIGKARRGEPLLFLLAVLVAWVAARAIQAPESHAAVPSAITLPKVAGPLRNLPSGLKIEPAAADGVTVPAERSTGLAAPRAITQRTAAPSDPQQVSASALPPLVIPERAAPAVALPLLALGAAAAPRSPPQAAPQAPVMSFVPRARTGSRWSGDAWLLLRDDDMEGPLVNGQPSYGRSQVGAVVRYALAPGSRHRPAAHLRVSAALAGPDDREAAVGFSGRPLPLPVRIVAEVRLSETDSGTHVRPALYAVTEVPPVSLPLSVQGEAYLQAGYVAGDFATAFVDGQARMDRQLVSAGDFALVAGAGAWGGAQEGASRLDIGPSATVSFHLGPVLGRVAADYRFRLAGDAEPASGPALTVSAGF